MVYGHPFTTFIFAIIDRPIGYRSGDLLLKLKFCDEWKPILYFIFPLEKYIHCQVIIRRNDLKTLVYLLQKEFGGCAADLTKKST